MNDSFHLPENTFSPVSKPGTSVWQSHTSIGKAGTGPSQTENCHGLPEGSQTENCLGLPEGSQTEHHCVLLETQAAVFYWVTGENF